jgi:outer membrane usher protein
MNVTALPEPGSGSKPGKPQIILAPLTVESADGGEVKFTVSGKPEDLRVDAEALITALRRWVKPEIIAKLRESVDADGNLPWQRLKDLGLEATFDQQELVAVIHVPPELRQAEMISLYGRRVPADAELALKPSAVSAYLNLRTGMDYVEQSQSGIDEGRQPVQFASEGALRAGPVVLESDAAYQEQSANPVRRDNTRMVYDVPERLLRLSVGDLSYPVAGQQSYQPMLGLTVARNFSLQPYRVTQPMGQTSFLLKRPSRVEVLVNGETVQTLQLQPGSHDLHDFQFASGANNVTLRITDDVGHVETMVLAFSFDSRLLAEGEQEFSYSVGAPSRIVSNELRYDESNPAFSLFHRLGVTDNLTLGLNLQGDTHLQMLGAEGVWARPWGTLQPEMALSHGNDDQVDYTGRIQYRYFNAATRYSSGNIWSFAAQFWSESFGTLGSSLSTNRPIVELSAGYSRRLTSTLSSGLGGMYQVSRDGVSDLQGVNLLLSKTWRRQMAAQLTLDCRRRGQATTEYRAYISFNWSFGHSRQTIYGSYDSLARQSRLDWAYNPEQLVGGIHATAGVQEHDATTELRGSARYVGYRAETELSHDLINPAGSNGNVENRDSLRFGSAIVYAEGQVAISRPVSDSFAMVVENAALEGKPIGLDPVGGRYSARADRLGPAVLPDLQSYLVRKLTIDAPDLPTGYELGPDTFVLWPSYKSGTVIHAGTGATVLLQGVLRTADGKPVALQTGTVHSLDNPTFKPLPMFTNRGGRFMVEGLQPGRYELRMLADTANKLSFEIPKGRVGVFEMGDLRFAEGIRFD